MFGAVGSVLGNPEQTVMKLRRTVKNGGYILLDDAYANDDSDTRCPTKMKWQDNFQSAGL